MKENCKTKVAIIGATGYGGRELLRILFAHSEVEIVSITSRENEGKDLGEVHLGFSGISTLRFEPFNPKAISKCDIVFISVPHTQSMKYVAELAVLSEFQNGKLKIIDLGTDFRLNSSQFQKVYTAQHSSPELLMHAVYGSPEIRSQEIKNATIIGNPGCFANCIILGLYPLASSGLIEGAIKVCAITGSSGSGATPTEKTHHPERNDSLAAYQVLAHRHVPEIVSQLCSASGNSSDITCELVPVSGPFSRGIFATSFVTLKKDGVDARALYETFSRENHFIRIRRETPRVIDVRGSNFCDISVHQQGREVVVISTIDNLVKGAAGNAVQCMNLMCGFDETTGLNMAPLSP